jgi:elongation factor G
LKQAKELAAANMTPEAAAARMTPEEAKRLSMVRNIGIAVCGLGPWDMCGRTPD